MLPGPSRKRRRIVEAQRHATMRVSSPEDVPRIIGTVAIFRKDNDSDLQEHLCRLGFAATTSLAELRELIGIKVHGGEHSNFSFLWPDDVIVPRKKEPSILLVRFCGQICIRYSRVDQEERFLARRGWHISHRRQKGRPYTADECSDRDHLRGPTSDLASSPYMVGKIRRSRPSRPVSAGSCQASDYAEHRSITASDKEISLDSTTVRLADYLWNNGRQSLSLMTSVPRDPVSQPDISKAQRQAVRLSSVQACSVGTDSAEPSVPTKFPPDPLSHCETIQAGKAGFITEKNKTSTSTEDRLPPLRPASLQMEPESLLEIIEGQLLPDTSLGDPPLILEDDKALLDAIPTSICDAVVTVEAPEGENMTDQTGPLSMLFGVSELEAIPEQAILAPTSIPPHLDGALQYPMPTIGRGSPFSPAEAQADTGSLLHTAANPLELGEELVALSFECQKHVLIPLKQSDMSPSADEQSAVAVPQSIPSESADTEARCNTLLISDKADLLTIDSVEVSKTQRGRIDSPATSLALFCKSPPSSAVPLRALLEPFSPSSIVQEHWLPSPSPAARASDVSRQLPETSTTEVQVASLLYSTWSSFLPGHACVFTLPASARPLDKQLVPVSKEESRMIRVSIDEQEGLEIADARIIQLAGLLYATWSTCLPNYVSSMTSAIQAFELPVYSPTPSIGSKASYSRRTRQQFSPGQADGALEAPISLVSEFSHVAVAPSISSFNDLSLSIASHLIPESDESVSNLSRASDTSLDRASAPDVQPLGQLYGLWSTELASYRPRLMTVRAASHAQDNIPAGLASTVTSASQGHGKSTAGDTTTAQGFPQSPSVEEKDTDSAASEPSTGPEPSTIKLRIAGQLYTLWAIGLSYYHASAAFSVPSQDPDNTPAELPCSQLPIPKDWNACSKALAEGITLTQPVPKSFFVESGPRGSAASEPSLAEAGSTKLVMADQMYNMWSTQLSSYATSHTQALAASQVENDSHAEVPSTYVSALDEAGLPDEASTDALDRAKTLPWSQLPESVAQALKGPESPSAPNDATDLQIAGPLCSLCTELAHYIDPAPGVLVATEVPSEITLPCDQPPDSPRVQLRIKTLTERADDAEASHPSSSPENVMAPTAADPLYARAGAAGIETAGTLYNLWSTQLASYVYYLAAVSPLIDVPAQPASSPLWKPPRDLCVETVTEEDNEAKTASPSPPLEGIAQVSAASGPSFARAGTQELHTADQFYIPWSTTLSSYTPFHAEVFAASQVEVVAPSELPCLQLPITSEGVAQGSLVLGSSEMRLGCQLHDPWSTQFASYVPSHAMVSIASRVESEISAELPCSQVLMTPNVRAPSTKGLTRKVLLPQSLASEAMAEACPIAELPSTSDLSIELRTAGHLYDVWSTKLVSYKFTLPKVLADQVGREIPSAIATGMQMDNLVDNSWSAVPRKYPSTSVASSIASGLAFSETDEANAVSPKPASLKEDEKGPRTSIVKGLLMDGRLLLLATEMILDQLIVHAFDTTSIEAHKLIIPLTKLNIDEYPLSDGENLQNDIYRNLRPVYSENRSLKGLALDFETLQSRIAKEEDFYLAQQGSTSSLDSADQQQLEEYTMHASAVRGMLIDGQYVLVSLHVAGSQIAVQAFDCVHGETYGTNVSLSELASTGTKDLTDGFAAILSGLHLVTSPLDTQNQTLTALKVVLPTKDVEQHQPTSPLSAASSFETTTSRDSTCKSVEKSRIVCGVCIKGRHFLVSVYQEDDQLTVYAFDPHNGDLCHTQITDAELTMAGLSSVSRIELCEMIPATLRLVPSGTNTGDTKEVLKADLHELHYEPRERSSSFFSTRGSMSQDDASMHDESDNGSIVRGIAVEGRHMIVALHEQVGQVLVAAFDPVAVESYKATVPVEDVLCKLDENIDVDSMQEVIFSGLRFVRESNVGGKLRLDVDLELGAAKLDSTAGTADNTASLETAPNNDEKGAEAGATMMMTGVTVDGQYFFACMHGVLDKTVIYAFDPVSCKTYTVHLSHMELERVGNERDEPDLLSQLQFRPGGAGTESVELTLDTQSLSHQQFAGLHQQSESEADNASPAQRPSPANVGGPIKALNIGGCYVMVSMHRHKGRVYVHAFDLAAAKAYTATLDTATPKMAETDSINTNGSSRLFSHEDAILQGLRFVSVQNDTVKKLIIDMYISL